MGLRAIWGNEVMVLPVLVFPLSSSPLITGVHLFPASPPACLLATADRQQPTMSAPPLPTKCLVEFLGTFFLCFTVACSAGQGAGLAGLAIGSTLMCAIYFGGHVSGANYNPAVSLALLVRGALPALDFGLYVVSQCLGALAAGLAALPLAYSLSWTGTANAQSGYNVIGHPEVMSTSAAGAALVDEIVLTFALCHVVLHTATTSFAEGKSCACAGPSPPGDPACVCCACW